MPGSTMTNRAETIAQRKARCTKILRRLRKLYPDANCALEHRSAFELLICTILSAQSTDETVNKVVPRLFAKYPEAESLASARQSEVERIIHSTGFFRQKARSVIGTSKALVENFEGNVPHEMDDLITLPGVARKTANVVLGTWFGKNEGVVVDTHVGRLASRLELTWRSKNGKDARVIEKDLMEVVPRRSWTYLSHALILHGRRVCIARKPRCRECELAKLCPSAEIGEGPSNGAS